MRRAMSHRRTVNSLTRKNAQRGATERPPWNERLYLAQIIRLRLRRAELVTVSICLCANHW